MIQFINTTKVYSNGVVGLNKLSLTINKGEFVFVIGASGSGKSTFLKLIMHEEEPNQGEIYVNDFRVHDMSNSEVPYLRRSLGIVFQDFRLLPNKTAFENVAFAMEIVEASSHQIRTRVPIALELVGLSKKANSYPAQMSGGEQQRIALARALVNNPSVIIADEPTGNLDPNTSWDIMDILEEVNRLGTTVIVSTHEKNIVNTMKKRVILLDHGQLKSDEKRGLYKDEN